MSDQKVQFNLMYIPFILFIVLVGVLLFGLGRDPTALDSARVGQKIPAFELPLLVDGKLNTQEGLMANRDELLKRVQTDDQSPWLLNVWASWCPQCYQEHGFIQALSDAGVVIVGLNYKDTPDKARGFLSQLSNPYSHILEDQQGDFGFDLGVYGAPETFVIAQSGEILVRHVGVLDRKIWDEKMANQFSKPVFDSPMTLKDDKS